MGKNKFNITQDNIIEWLRSTGYLFPKNKRELSRFEKLYPKVNRETKNTSIDPFAIIEGSRKPKKIQIQFEKDDNKEYSDLRMAARKFENLPDHIREKIKQNHKNNGGDKSEN
ncbi:MAG TPA: hypothetical protein VJ964_01710 [Balneolaceae bacterium]|nr:hypothetical protein [Balneolaceae bacterium]